ncbi:LamG-like jellyroll fold domain-containing protein [Paenibacillus xanthanilyticus]|uniref:LamG-like jellyroll fold domain-containing protein n=1 Tax=Paenibacillus xanthanilyticus TaxID=1783531 RepID=A0ABV8K044_9BACL
MNKTLRLSTAALLAAMLTLPAHAAFQPASAAAAVPTDATLHLKFEGSASDSSATQTPVTASGSPSYVAGRVGSAISFTAAGQYLNLGKTASTTFGASTDYTVAFWIQSSGVTGDPVIIGNKNWNSGANAGWILSLQSNGSIKWNYTPAGQTRTDVTISGVADDAWHYIAVTHNRDGSAKFYKDGQLVNTVSISAKQGSIDTTYNTNVAQDGTGSYGYALNAKLDEFQLFKRELSADEIAALYQSAPALPKKKKVLVIGIDGARPDALQAANTPAIDALVASGAYTWTANANSNYTWSATGWSTLHNGVWYAKHGVTDNSWTNANFTQYPSLMKRAEQHQSALSTASIVHWSPINTSLVDGIDLEKNVATDAAVVTETVNLLQNGNPDFLFLQFDDVDHAGHSYGFGPAVPQYLSAFQTVDGQIGTIVSAIKNRATYAQEDWLILLSTDHGGKGTSHGGSSAEERTIFFIASGDAAAKGPISAATNQTDVMVTALKHLGVPVQTSWNLDGKAVGLK